GGRCGREWGASMPDSRQMDWLEHALSHAPRPRFRAQPKADLGRMAAMTSATEATTALPLRQTAAPALRMRNAHAAIDFYARAFGAREIMRFEAGGRIAHAELQIGDSLIMMSEEAPDHGFPGPERLGGSPGGMHPRVDDADAMVERAGETGDQLGQ